MIGIFVEPTVEQIQFVDHCNVTLYQSLDLEVYEENGCFYAKSGADSPLLNGVVKCSLDNDQAKATVEKVVQFFEEKKLSHSWWVADEPPALAEALQKKGFEVIGDFPGMFLDLDKVQKPASSDDLIFEAVIDRKCFEKWGQVIAKAFQFSESVQKHYCNLFRQAIGKSLFFHLVGKKKGKIVCTGSVLIADQGAYLYNIATNQEERKHGYGTEMTYALIRIAKEHHCKWAGLVSSPMAASVYAKLGFKTVKSYHIYAQQPKD